MESVLMSNFDLRGRKMCGQKPGQPPILFQGEDTRSFLHHDFGESTQTGADFDHAIVLFEGCLLDDPARQVAIVQEILPEAAHRRDLDIAQRGLDLRKVHGRSPNPDRGMQGEADLFTKQCEQISEGGSNLFTSYSGTL